MKTINVFLFFAVLLANGCKAQEPNRKVTFTINPESKKTPISPYIYGVNDFKFPLNLIEDLNIPNRRLGGNLYSTYNWENNFVTLSPANDEEHEFQNSDRAIKDLPEDEQGLPAVVVTKFHDADLAHHMETLITIPMMGLLPKDKNGALNDNEQPPSNRFAKIRAFKNAPLSLSPDLSDDYVYTDENVHFLVNKYGSSKSETGIKYYELDNEPNFWQIGHKLLHPNKPTSEELISKSIETAKAIKSQDPDAKIFALNYGSLIAHWNYQNDPSYLRIKNEYPSFTAYFLKSMKDASEAAGMNLIDVIDLHYYSKAEPPGAVMTTETVDKTATDDKDIEVARMNAPLSLWNDNYVENSVFTKRNDGEPLDVIPNLKKTIDKYYPGLKISFGEYNFGGWNHISGGIAVADFLGILGKEDVFWASLWNTEPGPTSVPYYQLAAIKMYRNYDGKRSTFGDISVEATNKVKGKIDLASSVYASYSEKNKLHIIVINKNYDNSIEGSFDITGAKKFKKGSVWILDGSGSEIKETKPVEGISNNSFSYSIPAQSIIHIVLDEE